jgi:hypothetical protein
MQDDADSELLAFAGKRACKSFPKIPSLEETPICRYEVDHVLLSPL